MGEPPVGEVRAARGGEAETDPTLREDADQVAVEQSRPAEGRRIHPVARRWRALGLDRPRTYEVSQSTEGRNAFRWPLRFLSVGRDALAQHASEAVEALVFDQCQGGLRVGEVQTLAWLPAGAPSAHIHSAAVEVLEEVSAVGIALADEGHVVHAWLGEWSIDPRVGCQLDVQRPRADVREGPLGGGLGHDARVEARGDVAHQVELVHVVAREVDGWHARLADQIDRLGVDDGAVEVAEEEVERLPGVLGAELLEEPFVCTWLAAACPGGVGVIGPAREVEAHQLRGCGHDRHLPPRGGDVSSRGGEPPARRRAMAGPLARVDLLRDRRHATPDRRRRHLPGCASRAVQPRLLAQRACRAQELARWIKPGRSSGPRPFVISPSTSERVRRSW